MVKKTFGHSPVYTIISQILESRFPFKELES